MPINGTAFRNYLGILRLSSLQSEPWSGRRRGKKKKMPHVLWPEPLSAAQLKRLEEHKYSASGRSLLEPPLQIYWNWLVQQIPLWVAPNTLTIVGLLINVLTTAVLVFYCPTATEEVSSGVPGQSFYVAQNKVGEKGKVQDWRPLCNIQRQQSINVRCLLNLIDVDYYIYYLYWWEPFLFLNM